MFYIISVFLPLSLCFRYSVVSYHRIIPVDSLQLLLLTSADTTSWLDFQRQQAPLAIEEPRAYIRRVYYFQVQHLDYLTVLYECCFNRTFSRAPYAECQTQSPGCPGRKAGRRYISQRFALAAGPANKEGSSVTSRGQNANGVLQSLPIARAMASKPTRAMRCRNIARRWTGWGRACTTDASLRP